MKYHSTWYLKLASLCKSDTRLAWGFNPRPGAGIPRPGAGIPRPGAGVRRPGAGVRRPGAGVRLGLKPQARRVQPLQGCWVVLL